MPTKAPTLSTTTNVNEIWSSPDLLEQYEQARYTPLDYTRLRHILVLHILVGYIPLCYTP